MQNENQASSANMVAQFRNQQFSLLKLDEIYKLIVELADKMAE